MIALDININVSQLRQAIRKLPPKDRVQLVRSLEDEVWDERLNQIFKNIDLRRKKYKMTAKEIQQEIERGRQEFHERRR